MQHLFAIIVSIYPFDMEHLYSVVKVNQILSEYPSTLGSTIICRICLMTWKCNILCFYHIDTSIEYKGFVFFLESCPDIARVFIHACRYLISIIHSLIIFIAKKILFIEAIATSRSSANSMRHRGAAICGLHCCGPKL